MIPPLDLMTLHRPAFTTCHVHASASSSFCLPACVPQTRQRVCRGYHGRQTYCHHSTQPLRLPEHPSGHDRLPAQQPDRSVRNRDLADRSGSVGRALGCMGSVEDTGWRAAKLGIGSDTGFAGSDSRCEDVSLRGDKGFGRELTIGSVDFGIVGSGRAGIRRG